VTEDEAFDPAGVLKDGYGIRVPLMFRDASALADAGIGFHEGGDRLLVTDAAGGSAGLHRPGFRFIADAAMREHSIAAKEAAYRAADEADANAWRGSRESAEDDTLDQITADRLSLLDERERAYLEVEERDRNAWRNPR
jgi:hypothetical protein